MYQTICRVLAVLAVISLAGCTSFKPEAFNRAEHMQLKKIAVLTPYMDEKAAAWMAVNPGANFGLIGGIAAAVDQSNKSSTLSQEIKDQGLDQNALFVQALQTALAKQGYEVQVVDIKRPKSSFLESYPSTTPQVDAYLDIFATGFGYMAAGSTTPYHPTFYVTARLISATDKQVLFTDHIYYNAFGAANNAITITPSPDYEFPGFSDIKANPARVTDGLKLAITATAEQIAQQLK